MDMAPWLQNRPWLRLLIAVGVVEVALAGVTLVLANLLDRRSVDPYDSFVLLTQWPGMFAVAQLAETETVTNGIALSLVFFAVQVGVFFAIAMCGRALVRLVRRATAK